jgi:hypothetical protein
MRLPASGFLQFLGRRATRPLQHVEDLRSFAASTRRGFGGLGRSALLPFPGWAGLLTRPCLAGRDVARTFADIRFLVGFGSAVAAAGAVSGCSVLDVMFCSLGRHYSTQHQSLGSDRNTSRICGPGEPTISQMRSTGQAGARWMPVHN